MLYNYFKIAFRNLRKYTLFSFINILGLASGMMICLLALIDIKGSFDYDNFHPHPERTYRLLTDVVSKNNDRMAFATAPLPLADVLKKDYDFVEGATHFIRAYGEFDDGRKRLQPLTFWVDADFFSIFGYPIISGTAATAPHTAVITKSMSEKFFGKANPIGKVIQYEGAGAFTVTGIIDNTTPGRSHQRFDLLLSAQSLKSEALTDWKNHQEGYTYILLKPGITQKTFEKSLASVAARTTKIIQNTKINSYHFRPQALSDLAPSYEELMRGTYEPTYGKLATEMGVGLLTLLLAVFNYINLTLARALSRAREVGIRKVVGGLRWQVMAQFMAESVILSLLGLALAFVGLKMIEPMGFVQRWLIGGVKWGWETGLLFVVFSIVAGLLAGLVPARILSNFEPAQVLRSHTGLKVIRGISLRKSLIVVQFAVSLLAMITLYVLDRQQTYMAEGDYGFVREQVLTIPILPSQVADKLVNALHQQAGVTQVAATSDLFGSHPNTQWAYRQHDKNDSTLIDYFSINHQLVPALGLKLLAGQNFRPIDASKNRVIINEEALKGFGLGTAKEAIGKTIVLSNNREVSVAGVVQNFNYASFVWALKPLIFQYQPEKFQYLNVKVTTGSSAGTVAAIEKVWKQLYPYEPFAGQWYDDYLLERHSHDDDNNFLGVLTAIAFSIACMGLLGMVTYNTETRTKEVGIRKVMGAAVHQIIWSLSWDFVRLLLIASAIAIPLGYLAGMAILLNFSYHVSIGIETFGPCLALLFFIGGLTIGLQTYRSAIANPVKALRSE